jgi:O-antigen/teichoic acid export membrane protein
VLGAVGGWFAAPFLVPAIYGSAFTSAVPVCQVRLVSLAPHFVNSFTANVLLAWSRIREVLAVQLVLTIVNVVVNLLVVPRYGIMGAAATTVATETLGTAAYGLVFLKAKRSNATASAEVPVPAAPSAAS